MTKPTTMASAPTTSNPTAMNVKKPSTRSDIRYAPGRMRSAGRGTAISPPG